MRKSWLATRARSGPIFSHPCVSNAIRDLSTLANPASLAGTIAALQRGLLRIRHPDQHPRHSRR
jgi:hypothetical protein